MVIVCAVDRTPEGRCLGEHRNLGSPRFAGARKNRIVESDLVLYEFTRPKIERGDLSDFLAVLPNL